MAFTDLPNDYYFFYSVVLTYLIFLFHSLGVDEIKKKVSDVEILFISGAVGIVFYLILKQLTLRVIIPAISVLQNSHIPLTIWYYPPSIIENALSIATQLLVIAFCWLFFGIIFYFFCKIIQFCLDPDNKIFPNLERFKFIKNNNLRTIALFNIPIIFILLSSFVFILGYDYNFLQMIQMFIEGIKYMLLYDLFYAFYGFIGILISIAILLLIIRLLLREIGFLKKIFGFLVNYLKMIDILSVNLSCNFFTYQKAIIHSDLRKDSFEKWIFKNWKLVLAVLGLLILIFLFLSYIQPIYFGMKCDQHTDKVLCLPSGPFISQRLL
jgi:hypothetical protein